MASILIVCTGNICRSPMAEAFLRRALAARSDDEFDVSSSGTWGWEESPAVPEAVAAAAERGADISSHLARRLTPQQLQDSDLVLGMTAEHRNAAAAEFPAAASRTFTLKEMVRLLDHLLDRSPGSSETFATRIENAAELRRSGFVGNPLDEDVVDPLGMPPETYRAVAWEIERYCERLADGLVGRAPAEVVSEEG